MSFVDLYGGVTPTQNLSANDQNIFNPSTYGSAGGLTGTTLQGYGATLSQGPSGLVTSQLAGSPTPSQTLNNPQGTQATTAPSLPSNTPTAGSLADYFARGIIVVLGFIFVAVGLNMLRPGTVSVPKV
jgi:hypothetical protein